jgi:hypothetical protein
VRWGVSKRLSANNTNNTNGGHPSNVIPESRAADSSGTYFTAGAK